MLRIDARCPLFDLDQDESSGHWRGFPGDSKEDWASDCV